MKIKSIPSTWMRADGRRFDCGPYLSGALEAKMRLEELACPKDRLADLTAGHAGGIYNGPQFVRNFVDDPEYGVPFLGTTSMLRADLNNLPLLRKRDALSSKLAYLRIASGMTLISCSGTIGRMTYTRPDMEDIWSNQDILKVVPDNDKIRSGYLYAFLSSKFGVPLIISGTYGAIIQHIEPQHIADLPVPRLGNKMEHAVHDLIASAACARARAVQYKCDARRLLKEQLDLPDIFSSATSTSFATFSIRSKDLLRLDAGFHSPACKTAVTDLNECVPETYTLCDIAKVFTPGIFKRRYVNKPEYGYPYYSGSELFQLDAAPRGYLSKRWSKIEEYRVSTDWLLIQDAGQLGGLIGRVVRVPPHLDGSVVSNHLMRVAVEERETAAYLFALLTLERGYRAIIRNAFGSSIPQLDPAHIKQIPVPWLCQSIRAEVAEMVLNAWHLEDQAVISEREGVTLVEHAIEEAV